jgi:hypothetical protein
MQNIKFHATTEQLSIAIHNRLFELGYYVGWENNAAPYIFTFNKEIKYGSDFMEYGKSLHTELTLQDLYMPEFRQVAVIVDNMYVCQYKGYDFCVTEIKERIPPINLMDMPIFMEIIKSKRKELASDLRDRYGRLHYKKHSWWRLF